MKGVCTVQMAIVRRVLGTSQTPRQTKEGGKARTRTREGADKSENGWRGKEEKERGVHKDEEERKEKKCTRWNGLWGSTTVKQKNRKTKQNPMQRGVKEIKRNENEKERDGRRRRSKIFI